MIEIVKKSLEKGSGLFILLTVMILAIYGSQKLSNEHFAVIDSNALETKEALHRHDKRILVLEIRTNGN